MPTRLNPAQIAAELRSIPGWEEVDGRIRRSYSLQDFATALAFVNRVGELAENQGHHPDIVIEFNKVTLSLVTHSENGITDADFALARKIEDLPGAG